MKLLIQVKVHKTAVTKFIEGMEMQGFKTVNNGSGHVHFVNPNGSTNMNNSAFINPHDVKDCYIGIRPTESW